MPGRLQTLAKTQLNLRPLHWPSTLTGQNVDMVRLHEAAASASSFKVFLHCLDLSMAKRSVLMPALCQRTLARGQLAQHAFLQPAGRSVQASSLRPAHLPAKEKQSERCASDAKSQKHCQRQVMWKKCRYYRPQWSVATIEVTTFLNPASRCDCRGRILDKTWNREVTFRHGRRLMRAVKMQSRSVQHTAQADVARP